MFKPARGLVALIAAVTVYSLTSEPSRAITAELAKTCRAMAIKAHPTPVAGTKESGVEKAQRDFFQQCIARGGEMDNKEHKDGKEDKTSK